MIEELIVAFLPFAIVATATPGPNNLMVATSGSNFGFRRTIPHLLGITIGFPSMVFLVGMGLSQVFIAYPRIQQILHWVGAAYLLYLAARIALTEPVIHETADGKTKPLNFLQAAAFQWVNPKAWIMAIGAVTTYTQPQGNLYLQMAAIAAIFGLVCLPLVGGWTLFGVGIRRLFKARRALRTFNIAMALLLVASLVPGFIG